VYVTRDPKSEKIQKLLQDTPKSVAGSILTGGVEDAQVVVVATPFIDTETIIKGLGSLDGKIIIDATNPLKGDILWELVVGHTTSAGEKVAEWVGSGARVVKAFNTVSSNIMENPRIGDVSADLHIAGDDNDAKKVVADLAQSIGFTPLDVGKLTLARVTEPLALLYINLAYVQGHGTRSFIKYIPEVKK